MAQNVILSGGNQARGIPSAIQFGISRRSSVFQSGYAAFFAPLPEDPVGTHSLTLTNVVAGSRVFICDQAGTTTLYDQIAYGTTVVIPLDVYASGSTLNNWRIRVRKASTGTTYVPYETLMTATVGSSSIYVSQIPDE